MFVAVGSATAEDFSVCDLRLWNWDSIRIPVWETLFLVHCGEI